MTAIQPPPQHMQALAEANRVRLGRAVLKHRVNVGEQSVQDVLTGVPWEAASMQIADLLMSQHRWGRTRMRRFLARVPMVETKTVGAMTDRQRESLVKQLNGEYVGDPFGIVGWGRV